jgi:prepilin-type N-terminal cleavage/methylation domain-containing protein
MPQLSRSTSLLRARAHQRAFTLVELMIVVAIVGVLSIIAIVGYRKITLTAKISEAQNMISAIRIAQEDFKVERGTYADLGSTFCPTTGATQVKTAWNPGCAGGGTLASWASLPVHTDGPVQFGYATVAPPAALPAIGWIDMTAAVTTRPWYVIRAQADLNGDGLLKTELVGTSFQNTIFSRQEGE